MKIIIKLLCLYIVLNVFSCKGPNDDESNGNGGDSTEGASLPNNFDMDSAYNFVKKQVDFGPRVPNSESHKKCADWLEGMLKQWTDTLYIQSFTSQNYKGEDWKGTNLIGSFNPKNKNRLLLCAHWDTRPWADQDDKDTTSPSDGASDGASGVGILLEVARQLHLRKPEMGIDIVFFDLEDGGSNQNEVRNTWCLGSQYWSKHTHVADYKAKNGILLDMVGSRNALFAREGMSIRFDNNFLSKVWSTAASINFGNYFISYSRDAITDDHVYISYDARVPTIDIIEFDPNSPSGFGKYWHTHNDNMSIIDRLTLNAVGKTVLQVILNIDGGVSQ